MTKSIVVVSLGISQALLAVIAVCVLSAIALYCASLITRPKHLRTICELGPPREIKALLRIFGQQLEANTKADTERDAQMEALLDKVQELQRRQEQTDAVLTHLMASHTFAGGIDATDLD